MSNLFKFSSESLFKANFKVLQSDFTFLVNGTAFRTNKFIASLLSPVICNYLLSDETFDFYEINTEESRGNFQILLNLVCFGEQAVEREDSNFLCEILAMLQNSNIQIESNSKIHEITYENVFSHLFEDLKNPHLYQTIISKDIDIISQNMYQILSREEERRLLFQLDLDIVERIINNENLLIESEDQLLEFINSLYQANHESSILYQYVDFLYCTSTSLQTFLNVFSIEHINKSIWSQMKERFEYSIELKSNTRKQNHHFKSAQKQFNVLQFIKGVNDFDGIINYLRKQTNNQIENELKITASSILSDNENKSGPYNAIQYERKDRSEFSTENEPNSWICFEFKNHQIIPTHYTIRSIFSGEYAPINYQVEISKDQSTWEEIDRRNGDTFTHRQQGTLTFSIDANKQKEAKFIRLTQTGNNSSGNYYLNFQFIEFYGYLK